MTDYEIDIREIKDTLKKMQEDIKRLENNIPFYPTTYQYSPECFNSVPPTQACSEEELLKYYREPKANWVDKPEWDEVTQTWVINNHS